MIVQASKLWDNGVFEWSCPISLNCEGLKGQPFRRVWLTPTGCCSPTVLEITFEEPAAGVYFLTGIMVNYRGRDIVLDADTIDSIVQACNACCGENPVIPSFYNGVLPPVPDPEPFTDYLVERFDAGTATALGAAMQDYYGQYSLYYPFYRVSYDPATGKSVYAFKSNGTPFPVGGDTFLEVGGDFISNVAPELEEGEWFTFWGAFQGDPPAVTLKGDTLEDILLLTTALDPYRTYSELGGTFFVNTDNQIVLPANELLTEAVLTIAKETKPGVTNTVSNVVAASALPGFDYLFSTNLEVDGDPIGVLPELTDTTVAGLVSQAQTTLYYQHLGTWSAIATNTQIQLQSNYINGGTMQIVQNPLPGTYESNVPPTPAGGEWLVLNASFNSVPNTTLKALTTSQLQTLLENAVTYDGLGNWGIKPGNIMYVYNATGDATLNITAETIPAPVTFQSNAAPVLDPGNEYVISGTLSIGGDVVFNIPNLQAPDLVSLVGLLQGESLMSLMGAWEVDGTNPDIINLNSSLITSASIVIDQVTP